MTATRGLACLTRAIGMALTVALALALAALDLRLNSRLEVPPGLPGLSLGLALAASGFLFLGWRLRRAGRVRLDAYRATLALVLVGIVVVVREAVRLIGADWPWPGSILLGVNGLTLGAVGFMLAPAMRARLITPLDLDTEREDPRGDVETLVAEIQQAYRQHPTTAPLPLTTWEVVRAGVVDPARAFRELRVRPHLELCWVIPLLVVTWPRLTIFAGRDETAAALALRGLDYGLWVALYDAGKATMFWGLTRVLGHSLGYAAALGAFLVIDFPSVATYLIEHLWHGQYVAIGGGLYSQLGLAPLVRDLAPTHPAVFDALAKLDLVHVWTFALWWIAIATLVGAGRWLALALTCVTFPASHLFGWTAGLVVSFLAWR